MCVHGWKMELIITLHAVEETLSSETTIPTTTEEESASKPGSPTSTPSESDSEEPEGNCICQWCYRVKQAEPHKSLVR